MSRERISINPIARLQAFGDVGVGDIRDVLRDEGLDFHLEAIFEESADFALPTFVVFEPGVGGDFACAFDVVFGEIDFHCIIEIALSEIFRANTEELCLRNREASTFECE